MRIAAKQTTVELLVEIRNQLPEFSSNSETDIEMEGLLKKLDKVIRQVFPISNQCKSYHHIRCPYYSMNEHCWCKCHKGES